MLLFENVSKHSLKRNVFKIFLLINLYLAVLSQEEKGTTEDEMVGWHHQHNGHGFGWTLGVGDGQGGLACCSSWGRKESDMVERLN